MDTENTLTLEHPAIPPLPPATGSVDWWDATATENLINACLQKLESLSGKVPMGVARSMQRAQTALLESLANTRALKPNSPNASPSATEAPHD